MEALTARTKKAKEEACLSLQEAQTRRETRRGRQGGHSAETKKEKETIAKWWKAKWRLAWERSSHGKSSLAWRTPWKIHVPKMHLLLRRPESTMAILLCTKAIGFNDFLH
jgi:hypothetical protein